MKIVNTIKSTVALLAILFTSACGGGTSITGNKVVNLDELKTAIKEAQPGDNIIMANGVLLMPSFSNVDPTIENRAEKVYQSTLPPDWVVKRINCDKLVALRGQLHCMSYNIPNFIPIDGLLEKAIPKPLN